MVWPLSQDYNEAIQNPQTSFSDPDLRQGQVVTNALGIPQPCSGNFADVYAVECPSSGTKWAVKCFTREVHGLRERYAEISKHLRQARLRFTVDFQYLEEGIRVAGRWYPVLKMQWVEGFTLNAFIRDVLDKPGPLEALGRIWLRMAGRLRQSQLAHGDLQHGNVLLVPGDTASLLAVKLIDYDGMWVPSLAQAPSGEVGHSAYQHPQRLREGVYSPEVDRFPLLAIYCALRALVIGGRQLWERYDTGDNLLFQQQDFETPTRSPLMAELLRMQHTELPYLIGSLIDAARGPLDRVPDLVTLVPAEAPPPPSNGPNTTLRRNRTTVLSATPAPPVDVELVETNAFEDIEPEIRQEGSRRKARRVAQRSTGMWILVGSLAACTLLGGLFWAMSSPERSSKPPRDSEYTQARLDNVVPGEAVQDKAADTPKPPIARAENQPAESSKLPPTGTPQEKPADSPKSASIGKPEEKPAAPPKPLPIEKPADSPTPAPVAKVEDKPADPEKPLVPAKLPMPDKATQEKATTDIREIYKTDYAGRQAEDLILLAGKLLKRGMTSQEEPGHRFVYLREARDLAARAGDFALCLRAIDEMIKAFAVDPLSMKIAGVERAAVALRSPVAGKTLVAQALTIVDEAEAADDYEQALKLAGAVQKAAAKSGDPYLPWVVLQRSARLERLRKDYAKLEEAVRALAAKPGDPEANLSVGRFQCFVKEDWDKGLPLLALGADAELAGLARKDLNRPTGVAVESALGQAWLDWADKQGDASSKSAGQRRARDRLRAALPSLGGPEADRVASQLEVKKGSLKFRPGLVTELFNGENFERRVKTRIDYKLYHDWGTAAPDTGVPADHFSIRWQGWLTPPRPGKYTFTLIADDGARLFIDEQTLIDCWKQQRVEDRHSKDIELTAKPHLIRLEYREWFGPAYFHLLWSLEHGFPEQPIPLEWLSHDQKQAGVLVP